jgi:uncharacterized repeat protein (TIGR01451 family)
MIVAGRTDEDFITISPARAANRVRCSLLTRTALGAGLLLASLALDVRAANPANGLRIEAMAGPNLVVDSNGKEAPSAAYLGAKFCNDGTNVLTNVVVNIGNYSGTTNTPGVYPTRTHLTLVGPLAGGAFALTHEGGTMGASDATRSIGSLAPGECKTVYWLISYEQRDVNGQLVWGPSVKPDDDLFLFYDIWAQGSRAGSSIVTADVTEKITFRNEISAMANKIFPNGANKVPQEYLDLLAIYAPQWTNFSSDGSPGTPIVTSGYWYDLGNVGEGFDNDGDLVADHNLWMQPVGDASLFDPSCFRLVRTHALVVVKLKTGGEQVYIVDDQLYFQNVPENNGAVGLVQYEFTTLRGGCSGQLTPYQEVASGRDNEKFNGDYGASVGATLTSPTSSVQMAKDVDLPAANPGMTLSYSITFTNPGALNVGDPGASLPLVVQDRVPTGTFYLAGSATASNVLPAGVSSYTVYYSTNNGVTFQAFEPSPATNVTDIQWWLSDPFLTGTYGIVRFQAVVDVPYLQPTPFLVNTGGLSFGSTAPFLQDTAQTVVSGTNRLGDLVFVDDGSGGGTFGNQLQDGTEAGLTGIAVRLYFDANANGLADGSDILFATTTSGVSGAYLFTNLADGRFVAVVDSSDPDLPQGYSITTPQYFAADLDSGSVTGAMVQFLAADFGFAPVLSLDKSGSASIREGQTVTYTISISNRFVGNGVGGGIAVQTNLWATNGTGDTGWTQITNAYRPSSLDTNYAQAAFGSAPTDYLYLNGYSTNGSGNITNVQLISGVATTGAFRAADLVEINVFVTNALIFAYTNTAASYTNGLLTFNLTTNRAWTWSMFAATTVRWAATKGGGAAQGGSFQLDQSGFRITTDQTSGAVTNSNTLDPVPLTDTYNTNVLRFVSATPPVTTSTVSGATGTLYWANVGPIYPGGTGIVLVSFNVLEPVNNATSAVTNVAVVTNAYLMNGVPANKATDQVVSVLSPSGRIGDYIWRDQDGDGVQDTNEFGIVGVSVSLTPPPGIDLGNGAGSAITNVTTTNGFYSFATIPASGTYTVRVLTATLPGGTGTNTFDEDGVRNHQTAVLIDVNTSGTNNTHLTTDFGYQVGTTIEGTIWHDLNRNGTNAPDSGEQYLGGVIVYLCSNASPCGAGSALSTNVTDTNGYFRFVGNFTGTLSVSVHTNSGPMTNSSWAQSFDTDGTGSSNHVQVTVASGGVARVDYSYYQVGAFSVGDTLWYDWNANGTQQTNEEGIASITVSLYEDANSNGVVDTADALIGTQSTSATGTYLFTGLPSSNYLVIVDEADAQFPVDYTRTFDPQGFLDGRSTFRITTTNRLDQDFGYLATGSGAIGDTIWRDINGDGTQSGSGETGITNVTVRLFIDANNDTNYVLFAVTNSGASGQYLFSGLPDASYLVVVDTTDPDLPLDPFGSPWLPSTPTNYSVAVSGGSTNLAADFGFVQLGSIGDRIFWDANQDGTQGINEPGVTGATVQLYLDVNTNGLFDSGTDTLYGTAITDSNGVYTFSGLSTGRYVVHVVETGVLFGVALMADPDSDGIPCSATNAVGCDGDDGLLLGPAQNYVGADFGYVPPGVIGDTVWLDTDNDGVRDTNEIGLAYITVELYTNSTLIATNETDADGFYVFANLPDGTYRVLVRTNDLDFPSDLGQVYDPDGTNDHQGSSIVISNGVVVQIGGSTCSGCDLNVDFGYRYTGTNSLSGTVGLDGLPYDGVMGTGASGVGTNEAPFANVTVYLYLWDDDGDNVVEGGEYNLVVSGTTATNGDYAFTGLPDGDGNDRYIVSLAAPDSDLKLTTTNGSTPATLLVETTNLLGNTLSAYQAVPIASVITNMDFAFKYTLNFDFGDLPVAFSTQIQDTPTGPRHTIGGITNLYLGAGVDTEVNGQSSPGADGDGSDEDGVEAIGAWRIATNGGAVRTAIGAGSGWLLGYIDFTRDGDLLDPGELVFNIAVSNTGGNGAGVYTNIFAIPTNAVFSATSQTPFYARFRLFPDEQAFPVLAFSGPSDNGEVEDYLFTLGGVADTVWLDVNSDGIRTTNEPPLAGVRVYVDLNSDGEFQATEPSGTSDVFGVYGISGLNAGTYTVRVDTNTLPAGTTPVSDLDGAGSPHVASVTLTNSQYRLDADFGYIGSAAIGDFVWNDTSADGIQDGGESGISGVGVLLYDANTNLLASTTTGAGGLYAFSNLVAGTYLIQFVEPSGYDFTLQDQGGDSADSDADPATGFTTTIILNATQSDLTWDAGLTALASASYLLEKSLLAPTNRPAAVGETLTFRIAVTNSGSLNLSPVRIDDTFDTNYLAFVGAVPPANATNGGAITWSNIGVIGVGQIGTITAQFTAVSGILTSATTNVALSTVTATNGDPVASQTSAVPVQIAGPAVTVVKSRIEPAAGPALVGSSIVFRISISNAGDVALDTVPLTDTFNTSLLAYQASIPALDGLTSGVANWANVGPLAVGGSTVVTMYFTAATSGAGTNFATAAPTTTNGVPVPPATSSAPHAAVAPGILVIKTAGTAPDGGMLFVAPGSNVVYTYQVVNTGDTYLSSITVTDDVIGAIGSIAGPVAPGATNFLVATNLSVSDAVTNIAYVSGTPTDAGGTNLNVGTVTDSDDAVVLLSNPGLSITKTALGAADGATLNVLSGSNVVYAYAVVNIGDVGLTNIVVTDNVLGVVGTIAGPLAPGGTNTLLATNLNVTADVTNVAEAVGYPTNGLPPVSKTDDAVVDVVHPGLVLIKTAGNAADGGTFSVLEGANVTYAYAVVNTGDTYLSSITVTDNVLGTIGTIAGPVAPNSTNTLLATNLNVMADVTNIAFAVGTPTDAGGTNLNVGTVGDSDDAVVDVVRPGVTLLKTAGAAADGSPLFVLSGSNVVYRYEVVNTGDTYLVSMTVTDDVLGVVGSLAGPVAPGDTNVFFATNLNVAAGVTNVGVVVATPSDGAGTNMSVGTVTDADDAVVLLTAPAITVVKTAAGAADGATLSVLSGSNVVYAYAVINSGDVALTNIVVNDDVLGSVGTVTGPLAPGATNILFATNLNVTADVTNIATVTGYPTNGLPAVTNTDPALVDVVHPGLLVIKTAATAPDGGIYTNYPGSNVVYRYEVINTGDTYLSSITVTDDVLGAIGNIAGPVAPGSTNVLLATNLNVTANVTNLAVAAGTPTDAGGTNLNVGTVSDADDAVVSVLAVADLSLVKDVDDATPDFGSNVVFTITVSNAGPNGATGVLVEDPLPAGLAYVSHSGGTYDSNNGEWAIEILPSGSATSLQITATVTNTGTITNDAEVALAVQFDPDSTPGNMDGPPYEDDEDDAVLTVGALSADLELAKTVNLSTTVIGSNVTFTLVVTNKGPNAVGAASVLDLLPAGLSYVSHSGGAYNPTNGIWTNIALASGASTSLQIVATVTNGTIITNVAQVETSDTSDPDSTPGNDVPAEDDLDEAIVAVANPEVSITKTAGAAADGDTEYVLPGSNVVYTYTVVNSGNTFLSSMTVSDDVLGVVGTIPGPVAPGATNVLLATNLNLTSYVLNVGDVSANPTDGGGVDLPGLPDVTDSDDAEADVARAGVVLVKTAASAADGAVHYAASGANVVYTYAIINTGNTHLASVTVTDDVLGVVGTIPGSVAPTTTNFLYATNFNVTADVTNIAVVTATPVDPDSLPMPNIPDVSDTDDAVVAVSAPGISVVKTAGSAADGGTLSVLSGSNVVFTYQVINNGDVALTNIVVNDDVLGPVGTIAGPLAPNATNILYATNLNVTADVTNIATATGYPTNGLPAVTNTDPAVVDVVHPGLLIVKTAGSAADGSTWSVPSGSNVVFTYRVVNTGDTYLSSITVTDDVLGAVGNVAGPVAPGATNILLATNLNVAADVTNVAVAVGTPTDAGGTNLNVGTVTDNDDAVVDVVHPGVVLVKTAGTALDGEPFFITNGADVVYTYSVINTGDTYLSSITVTDDVIGAIGTVPGPVAPGSTNVLLATNLNVTSHITNIAVVTANPTDSGGSDLPDVGDVTDTDDAVVDIVHAQIGMAKTLVSPTGRPAVTGETLVFRITLTNEGDAVLLPVELSDTFDTNLMSFVSATPSEDSLVGNVLTWTNLGPLGLGGSTVVTARFTAVRSGVGTNVALATPDTTNGIPVPPATSSAPHEAVSPGVGIVKALVSPSGRPAVTGETVVFRITVTNSGDVTLDTVPVTDTFNTNYLVFASASPAQDSLAGNVLTWNNVGPLLAGQTAVVTARFTAARSGLETNFASASPTTTNGIPVPPSTSSVPHSAVNPLVLVSKALLSPSGRPAATGETLVFRITVTNAGDVTLDTVPLVDTFQSNLVAFVSAQPAQDALVGNVLTWNNVGPLAAGGSAVITAQFTAVTSGAGTNAAVSAPSTTNGVPVPPQTSSAPHEATTASIAVTKTAGAAQDGSTLHVLSGSNVVYRYAVVNTGESTLTNIVVTDDVLGPVGTIAGPVAPGATNILLATNLNVTADVVNIATVTGYPTNGLPAVTNTDPAVVDVVHPGLLIVKTAGSAVDGATLSVLSGSNVVYTYRVVNTGDTYLSSITVTDDVLGAVGNIAGPVAPGATNVLLATNLNVTAGVTNLAVAVGTPTDAGGTNLNVGTVTDTDDAVVHVSAPGIAVIKTAGSAQDGATLYVLTGTNVVYTYAVINTGDVGLTNVVVADDILGTIGSIPGPMAPGATNTLLATNLSVAADVVNIATVTGYPTNGLPVVTNADDAVVDVISPSASVTKTLVSPAGRPAVTGETVVFRITVTNSGDVALDSVPLTDTFQSNLLAFVSAQPTQNTLVGNVLTWANVGPLAVGGTAVVTAQFTAVTSGQGTNAAVASPTLTNGVPVPPSTSSAPHAAVNPLVDVSKTLVSPSGRPAATGETLVFRITVTNAGNVTLDTVPLVDTFASNLMSFVSATPAQDSLAGNVLTWNNVGPLAVGGSAVVTARFTAAVVGTATNTVVASPTTTNGVPVPPSTSSAPHAATSPGVAVTKTLTSPSGRPAATGETVVFTIVVTNTGGIALDAVPLVDTFNAGLLSFLSATPAQDDLTGNVLTWTNLGPLGIGGSAVVTARFTAVSSGSGNNTAVSAPTTTNGVPVPPSTSSAPHEAVAPSVGIAKTLVSPSGRPAAVGETLVFRIAVTNSGNVALDTVPLADTFASNLMSFVSATPANDGLVGNVLTWNNVGPLLVGQTAVVTARFTALVSGSGTNIAVASPTTTNGVPVPPSTSSAPHAAVSPSVLVTKTILSPTNRSAAVGEPVVFRIGITNTGDVTLDTVPLTDTFNTNLLSFVFAAPAQSSLSGGTVTWTNLGSLAVGGATNVTIQFTALASGTGTNVASSAPTTTNGVPVPPSTGTAPHVAAQPGYNVTKTLTSPTGRAAQVGEAVTFSITVANTGNVALGSIPLSDTYETSYLSYVGSTPPSDDNTDDGAIGWTDVGPLASGASTTIVVNFTAAGSTSSQPRTNVVVATPTTATNEPPVPPKTNSAPYEISRAGFSVTKTLTSPSGRAAQVGEAVTFTLTVANTGDVSLVTVPVSDTYETAFLAYVGATPASDNNVNDGVIDWANIGPLPAGATTNITVTFTAVNSSTSAPRLNIVVASPTTPTNEPPVPPQTNNAPYETSRAGYSVAKALTSPPGRAAQVGEGVTFTLTVANTGDVDLVTVPVVDTYQTAHLAYVGATPTSIDNADDGTINWADIGPLPAGASTSILVSFTASGSSTGAARTNVVVALPSTATNEPPVVPLTNRATYAVSRAGYVLAKTLVAPTNRPPIFGEAVTFQITVRNTGDVQLVTVALADTYNTASLTYTGAVPASDDNVNDGTIAWANVGPLNAGAGATVTVFFTAAGAGGPQQTNTATASPVTPTNAPPVPPQTSSAPYIVDAPASLGDFLWNDLDADGVQDGGETGVANVVVELYNTNGVVIATTTTDVNGAYAFTNLVQGGYYIDLDVPVGWLVSPPNQGGDPALDSDIDSAGSTATVTLSPGDAETALDGALYQAATVGDFVWNDLDNDGIQDGGEPGLAGVAVVLYATNGVVIATNVTDAGGVYAFTNVVPGDYYVAFLSLAGYVRSPQDQGIDTDDSDADTNTGYTVGTSLSSGESDVSWDAGYHLIPTGQIGNLVFSDVNTNGVYDPGVDAPLANVTVQLTQGQVIIDSQVTDSNGLYRFTGVEPGSYEVDVVEATLPPGMTAGPLGSSGVDNNSQAQPYSVTIASGEINLTADFGFVLAGPLSIGDTVYFDFNSNGVQNANDIGVSGVVVQLYLDVNGDGLLDVGDALIGSSVTASNGTYLFGGLDATNYLVVVQDPSNRLAGTVQSQGVNPEPVAATNGLDNLDVDFGYFPTNRVGSLGDVVWVDVNMNGNPADEDLAVRGLNGATVRLFKIDNGTTNLVATTTTTNGPGGIRGYYVFTNLPYGDYYVEITPGTVPANLTVPTTPLNYTRNIGPPVSHADADFGFIAANPTAIELTYFRAEDVDGLVALTWATAWEQNTLGYNVYRATSVDGERVRLNGGDPIPGQGGESGYDYQYNDATVSEGVTYWYWLEEVETDGAATLYGPVSVRIGGDEQGEAGSFKAAAAVYRITYEALVASGIPADRIDPAQYHITVDGREVAALVLAYGGAMRPGDFLMAYVPAGAGERKVSVVVDPSESRRMEWVYAEPVEGEGVTFTALAENGVAGFETADGVVRYLLAGFGAQPVWIFDVTDPSQPKFLFGAATVEVPDGIGAYFSYFSEGPARGLAIDEEAVKDVTSLDLPTR